MMKFSLLLDQGYPDMDNVMFSGTEIPSKLGLLLVDDEEFNLKALKRTLRGHGFNIFCAPNGETALQIMEDENIAIIVSDMRMPSMSGDELLIKIDERWPETLKVILTGYTDISNTLNVLHHASIFRYISKPWDDELLLSTLLEASAIYWARVIDFYFEKSTKKENIKLQDANQHLKESVNQSHSQLKKINEKLKSAYEGERRLRKERQEAERESIAKSQFLATMSHEIRTPLNSIIATNSLLLESDLTDDQRELVNLSLNGGNILLSLIGDILDFSKINAGKLELNESWFNIIDVIDETCELLSSQVIDKPVDVAAVIHRHTPTEVYGDETRIRQIITNLISNALKFTEAGCVELEIQYDQSLSISINDSGIGMSEQDVTSIFDEFTQIDSGNTRTQGGTGLGLSICRQLTHLMGGEIQVQSTLGQGSHFCVTLPLEGRKEVSFPAFSGATRKLLLISSNKHLHRTLNKQLTFFNCRLDHELITPETVDSSYDAILYDTDTVCDYPAANSKESTSDNELHNKAKHLKVALIANDGIGRSKLTYSHGFDTILRKPFRICSLLKQLIFSIENKPLLNTFNPNQEEIIKQWTSKSNPQVQDRTNHSLNASILIAEDSPSNQAVINSILKNMDADVDIANNGEEAVSRANERAYDIILMDMAMPRMDGITATSIIRKDSIYNHTTPIIALTANAYSDDKIRCFNSGMDDFLQKPIDIKLFREKITTWIKKAKNDNPEEKIDEANNTPTHEVEDTLEKSIDLKIIRQLEKDTSTEVLPSIIDIFLSETKARLPLMNQLFASKDWQALAEQAHTLKSSAGSFGATTLSIIAGKIEEAVRDDDTTEIESLQPLLNSHYESSLKELGEIVKNGV
ncbi:response regulator [Agaribacterium sp. ZY112]|uniref:response regulator n=1 Tax=Agaribacterium sp. ZY112 TaxID=3233574 RepID=UPI0035262A32